MNSKVLELAKKLYELRKRGVGGEKDNATEKLQQLIDRHGISWEMLEEKETHDKDFFIEHDQMKFFLQVVGSVIGNDYRVFERTYDGLDPKKRNLIIQLDNADFIEISAKFEFFWARYKEEETLFMRAFVQKNHLYVKPTDKDMENKKSLSDMSREEIAEYMKMREMMQLLNQHTYRKQLNS